MGRASSPQTVSELNQKIYEQIDAWRAPLLGEHTYVFLDGIWLKRSWGGEVKNIAVLVAIGVRRRAIVRFWRSKGEGGQGELAASCVT